MQATLQHRCTGVRAGAQGRRAGGAARRIASGASNNKRGRRGRAAPDPVLCPPQPARLTSVLSGATTSGACLRRKCWMRQGLAVVRTPLPEICGPPDSHALPPRWDTSKASCVIAQPLAVRTCRPRGPHGLPRPPEEPLRPTRGGPQRPGRHAVVATGAVAATTGAAPTAA